MNKKNNKRGELLAFIFLVFGMSIAGYAYQANKDTIAKTVLVPVIIASLFLLYGVYVIVVRSLAKK